MHAHNACVGTHTSRMLAEQRDRAFLNPYIAGQIMTTLAHRCCAMRDKAGSAATATLEAAKGVVVENESLAQLLSSLRI